MTTTQSQSQPQPPPLPLPRTFMTSLFNSLTTTTTTISSLNQPSTSASTSHKASNSREIEKENTNPLKSIEAEKKALLMTLHVIFPPPLLLQALDLLDRGGVGRVILGMDGKDGDGRVDGGTGEDLRGGGEGGEVGKGKSDGAKDIATEEENIAPKDRVKSGDGALHEERDEVSTSRDISGSVHPPQAHIHLPHPTSNPKPPQKITIYQVRSSQPSKWNSSHAATRGIRTSENTYTVHLSAWNCTCAAFTYSAFPASSSSSSSSCPWTNNPTSSSFSPYTSDSYSKKEVEEEIWNYGGPTKSSDSQIPICKHLLACLLGERWGNVLRTYIWERVVGRDEMGGLFV